MVGGAISGYCATGRRKNATPPRITKTIETTEAKIGRSMKKCEIRMGCRRPLFRLLRRASRRGWPRRLGALLLGPNFLTRPRLHQAADHDAIIGTDAILDNAEIVRRKLTQRHVFRPRYVLRIYDHDKSARLLSADGRIRNKQR